MQNKTFSEPRIIVALDFDNRPDFDKFIERLDPKHCRIKIGKSLFTRFGPIVVEETMKRGFDVFLDLKFHDIPQQVALACRAAADLNVWMLTVHAFGGAQMLAAAKEALIPYQNPPLLMAVTVLTSLNTDDLHAIGIPVSPEEQVLRLAKLALNSGVDGIVCSPQEVRLLRENFKGDYCLVTPGVRPAGIQFQDTSPDDQKRTLTPSEAIKAGSTYIVIGRPITKAANPVQLLAELELDIRSNCM